MEIKVLSFEEWLAKMNAASLGDDMLVGVELERVIVDKDGNPLPIAPQILPDLDSSLHSPELSAWQMECKTPPVLFEKLYDELRQVMREQEAAVRSHGANIRAMPVVYDGNPPILINPEYKDVAEMIKRRAGMDGLKAALAVASWQLNIGCLDAVQCIDRYNNLVVAIDELIVMGDCSKGQRLQIYRRASPNCNPIHLESVRALYNLLVSRGLTNDPTRLHTLIQIKPGWVIEVRVFDATDDVQSICNITWSTLMIARGLKPTTKSSIKSGYYK